MTDTRPKQPAPGRGADDFALAIQFRRKAPATSHSLRRSPLVATRSLAQATQQCSRVMSTEWSGAPPNPRLKLSARGRHPCRNAQWKPSILIVAPAGRSLSAIR